MTKLLFNCCSSLIFRSKMAPELLIQISGHWSISRLPTAIVEDKEMKFHVIVYIQISEVRLDKAS